MKNKAIYKLAKKKGICKEWAEKIKNASEKQLAQMFFDGSDWAFENDFPTRELLEAHPNAMDYGLHLDAEKGKYKGVERLAFFGNSHANLIYDDFEVAEVYARHNSEIEIKASDNTIVFVSVEDNASVHVECTDKAFVKVSRFNGKISGNPTKIIERKWEA